MKILLAVLGLYLILFIIDKTINFKRGRSLNIVYFLYNLLIYSTFQFFYVMSYLYGGLDESKFIYIRLGYAVIVNLALLGLLIREVYESRNYSHLLISLKTIILSVVSVFLFPLSLGIFLTKEIMDTLFYNIKTNYLIYNKRYSRKGYDSLIKPEIYDEKFYHDNYFNDEILNKIFTYFSASYERESINKKLVYASRNLDDEENLEKISQAYMERENGLYPVLSNIKYSLLNRYEDNIIFKMDEIIELENINRFMQFLLPGLISYDKVDFNYKIYIMDLNELLLPESFKLFSLNEPRAYEYDIVKAFKIKPDIINIDPLELGRHLYSFVQKDLIYSNIFEYFNVKEEEKRYSINESKNFSLEYDSRNKIFYLRTDEYGRIAVLEDEKLDYVTKMNMPFNDNVELIFNDELSTDDRQVYEIIDDENLDTKPYLLDMEVFIRLDFSNINEAERPDMDLLVKIGYNINILE